MDDADVASDALTMDPDRSNVLLFVGTKGSGKSAAARVYFDAWPYDRLVIDPSGDARPEDPYTLAMTAPFPSQMPSVEEAARQLGVEPEVLGGRVTVWARVDPRSATFEADMDAALGLALYPRHRNVLVWEDEYGLTGNAQRISPNMKLALLSSRHYYLSMLLLCPRPRHIPTLTIQQADKIFVFRQPQPEDRETVAKNAGVDYPLFERQYQDSRRRGKHAFLLWDPAQEALINCPPLPNVSTAGPRS